MTQTKIAKNRISRKAASFTESAIREMTREAMKYGRGQSRPGLSGFRGSVRTSSKRRWRPIAADHNQYAITWGVKSFRDAIAKKTMWFLGIDLDPEARDHGHVRFDRGDDRRDDGDRRPDRRGHRL